MRKRNCASDNTLSCKLQAASCKRSALACSLQLVACSLLIGCATPEYAIRPTPVPEESAEARDIERAVSAVQAEEFTRQGARPVGSTERLGGFVIQRVVDRLSHVSERPALRYRTFLYRDRDPNAAALADGRIYLSTGLLSYLSGRGPSTSLRAVVSEHRESDHGSREDELAFILGHELAHTVAQHLVKRYRTLQQQEAFLALISALTSAATRGAGEGVQQAGQLGLKAAALLRDVKNSGFSQEQELEADQVGIQYVRRAGYDPQAALDLLEDFARFDTPMPFLRTHPHIVERRAQLARYLGETGGAVSGVADGERTDRLRRLREAQRLYPPGSVSWTNLQRQIDALEKERKIDALRGR